MSLALGQSALETGLAVAVRAGPALSRKATDNHAEIPPQPTMKPKATESITTTLPTGACPRQGIQARSAPASLAVAHLPERIPPDFSRLGVLVRGDFAFVGEWSHRAWGLGE